MKTSYDVVVLGLSRSDNALSSVTKAFAKELANTHRVFYIDRPYSFKDLFAVLYSASFRKKILALLFGIGSFRIQKFGDVSIVQVIPGLTLPINFLPQGKFFDFLNRYNNYIINCAILKTIKRYNVKQYVYLNSFLPVLVPSISKKFKYQPLLNIYQSFDEMSGEAYIAKHGQVAEELAICVSDIAIATSSKLCERHSVKSKRKVNLIANGVDFNLFENAKYKDLDRPIEFLEFKNPVILYTGHYSDLRLDSDLIIKICKSFKNCEIVFVGTYEALDLEKFGLNTIENLHFIGPKKMEELPAFLKYAQVGIIPNKLNELTAGIYPLKVNEYLAAGLPCVSTSFSEDMQEFAPYVYLVNTNEEFVEKIQLALREDPMQKLNERVQFASKNSWQNRIVQLESLVGDYLKDKKIK